MSTTITQATKASIFYCGLENGVDVTGWDRRRDKIHAKLKMRMRDRNAAAEKAFKREIEALRYRLGRRQLTLAQAKEKERDLRAGLKEAKTETKFEIRSQRFLEKR